MCMYVCYYKIYVVVVVVQASLQRASVAWPHLIDRKWSGTAACVVLVSVEGVDSDDWVAHVVNRLVPLARQLSRHSRSDDGWALVDERARRVRGSLAYGIVLQHEPTKRGELQSVCASFCVDACRWNERLSHCNVRAEPMTSVAQFDALPLWSAEDMLAPLDERLQSLVCCIIVCFFEI